MPPETDFGIRRFAVLYHSGVEQPHYDFMFDTADDSQLVTFRVSEWPLTKSQMVTRLRDHRRAYLTFQGTIPGDRGEIHRVDEGKMRVIQTVKGWRLEHSDGSEFVQIEPENPNDRGQSEWWVAIKTSDES